MSFLSCAYALLLSGETGDIGERGPKNTELVDAPSGLIGESGFDGINGIPGKDGIPGIRGRYSYLQPVSYVGL